MHRVLSLILLTLAACGPTATDSSIDSGSSSSCTAFDCAELVTCSALSGVSQCDDLCGCYASRWSADAFSDFSSCAQSCQVVGDTYSTCFVTASNEQPPFDDAQYISNCEAKRSVCAGYPADACDPVTLRMLSDASMSDMVDCLGDVCDGTAQQCVADVLYCGNTP